MSDDGASGHPSLRELLDDPLVRLVMRSDGVEPDHVRTLFERLRHSRVLLPATAEEPSAVILVAAMAP